MKGKPDVFRLFLSHYLECLHICAYHWRMDIEFDPEKAAINPINHEGVTFEEAQVVLLDPFALTREDGDTFGEQRFVSLGVGAKHRVWWSYGCYAVSVSV